MLKTWSPEKMLTWNIGFGRSILLTLIAPQLFMGLYIHTQTRAYTCNSKFEMECVIRDRY